MLQSSVYCDRVGDEKMSALTDFQADIPKRVRVLVLGGGIHGAGVLHDMASRGWKDVHLVEKNKLGLGTSGRSTKLVHGGLRYLKRISDFHLVKEALSERALLLKNVPDLVKPIELYLPILKKGGMPGYMAKVGLSLYDGLSGQQKIALHKKLSIEQAREMAPLLNYDLFKSVYSYWDAQTDDHRLVRRVAASAVKLGAGVSENCRALRVAKTDDGFEVVVECQGKTQAISAKYVVNCLGPWAHELFADGGIEPQFTGINNRGSHLVFQDMGLKVGFFLQSNNDSRIFFMLPWEGYTLLGTTEALQKSSADDLQTKPEEVQLLINMANKYLNVPLRENDILEAFTGLRWLAVEKGKSLTKTSRAHVVSELPSGRGVLYTLYGGKLTTYRSLSEEIGDLIMSHFGEVCPSKTSDSASWASANEVPQGELPVLKRW